MTGRKQSWESWLEEINSADNVFVFFLNNYLIWLSLDGIVISLIIMNYKSWIIVFKNRKLNISFLVVLFGSFSDLFGEFG